MSSSEVVDNVTQAAEHISVHNEAFYLSVEFWIAVAFILTILVILKPAVITMMTLIDTRIKRIKKELDDAENLKIDAQQLYSDYERKLSNVKKEIDDILNEENLIIANNREIKTAELNSLLRKKQIEIDGKIELSCEQIKKEINQEIANKTIKILEEIIKKKLNKSMQQKLIEKTIKNIAKLEI